MQKDDPRDPHSIAVERCSVSKPPKIEDFYFISRSILEDAPADSYEQSLTELKKMVDAYHMILTKVDGRSEHEVEGFYINRRALEFEHLASAV